MLKDYIFDTGVPYLHAKNYDLIVSDFRGVKIDTLTELWMHDDLIHLLQKGQLTWLPIHHDGDYAAFPYRHETPSNRIPLYDELGENRGSILIPRITIGKIKDWTSDHPAITERGFKDLQHMLGSYTERWKPEDYLTAINLSEYRPHWRSEFQDMDEYDT